MRLTAKHKNSYDVDEYCTNGKMSSDIVYVDDDKNFTNACIDKLGMLEDIEEKLGVSLFIFHELEEKLFSNGENDIVFFKDGNEIYEGHINGINYARRELLICVGRNDDNDNRKLFIFEFGSYDKDYAFTKEDKE